MVERKLLLQIKKGLIKAIEDELSVTEGAELIGAVNLALGLDVYDGTVPKPAQIEASVNVIPFTQDAVKTLLDNFIGFWRLEHDKGDEGALYYVDAYQSVRMSLFGELLGAGGK